MFPIGGAGFSPSAGLNININIGGGMGGVAPGGLDMGCGCGGGGLGFQDGFSPSSEFMQGPGFGLSPFGPPGLNNFASQLAGSSMPDFTGYLNASNPGFDSLGLGMDGLPMSLLSEGSGLLDGGGLPFMGDGSLTSQALMMQAASSDLNQASLIGAQTGGIESLMGAQGMALAGGISPLMSGLSGAYF